MPIRSRLQNTGLKLKIPVRNSSNFNPYTSTRHSSSPRGREGSDGRDGSNGRPRWPSNSPARTKTVKFDASVDNRPVWEMETEKSPNFSDDFRAIPIQIVRNKTTVNILACDNSNIKPPSGASRLFISSSRPSWTTRPPRTTGRTCDSEPSSPIFDLTPSPVLLRSRGSKARLKSRNFERRDEGRVEDKALHLLDWFHKLSPQIQNQHKTKSSETKHIIPIQTFQKSSVLTGGTSDSSILSPTENSLLENPLSFANSRRDSGGALQSPDVLDSPKEDGFYLLKKDSQRRETLVKVLRQDKNNICSTWYSLMLKDVSDCCLTVSHLSTLMEGLRGYLPEQNREVLESVLAKLKDELDYDGAKINHLHLALYNFQDAVNAVLRMHSIKPHWMFALDNLVRTAVQAAILVLSPELGAHLADQGAPVLEPPVYEPHPAPPEVPVLDAEGCSTSGVSTVNSGFQESAQPSAMLTSLSRLREENRHLLGDLLQAQHSYQELLRQSLAEQKLHLQLLSQSLAASSLAVKEKHRLPGHSSQMYQEDDNEMSTSHQVEDDERENLISWLQNLNLNSETISRMVSEQLSLTDLLELITRDDLRRLGLKAGPELRIWRAICKQREQN